MVINERFQTLENIFVVAILAILNNHRLAGYFEGEVDRTVFSDLFITIEDHLVTLRIEVFPSGRQGEAGRLIHAMRKQRSDGPIRLNGGRFIIFYYEPVLTQTF